MMDPNETSVIDCAKRELKEETGLTPDEVFHKQDSWKYYTDPSKSNSMASGCIAYINGDAE